MSPRARSPVACALSTVLGLGLALALPEGCGAAVTVEPGTLTIASRTSYLLGDGRRAFLDEDGRRALLGLRMTSDAPGTILGYDALVIDQAVADSGETLQITLPQTSGPSQERRPHGASAEEAPAAVLFAIGLPAPARAYGGLATLRGHVALVVASSRPRTWVTPLAACSLTQALPIDGHPELTVSLLAAPDPTHTMLRLSVPARWAIVSIEVQGPDGVSLKLHSPRIEHRDPPQAVPGIDKIDTMTWLQVLPPGALLAIRYYPTITQLPVAFSLGPIAFGVQLPSATALLRGQPRGANDL